MRRIGIMGGTFNPIHNGHLAIAKKAKEQFALEKVLFMPSGVPYMKDRQEVLPVSVRCEMTALAIADIPYFELSLLEAANAELGKNTYTFETLQKLRDADPKAEYYFILGADSLYAIENWKNPTLIFQNCTILTAARTEEADVSAKTQRLSEGGTCEKAKNGTYCAALQDKLLQQAQYLREKYHASVEILEFAGIDVSSTQIREKVRYNESIGRLVPKAVEQYISENECYR